MVFSSLVGDGSGNAGSADGTGSAATFNQPNGLATDILGNLYVADTGNSTIRKVSPSGIVTTFAGSAGQSGNADGVGTYARFSNPCGVAVDGSGNVYVADTGNHTIRKISPAGSVSTLAGLSGQAGSSDGSGSTARFNTPSGIAVDALNNVYVADSGNNTIRVITSGGVVRTLAGLAGQSGNLDAFGIGARFNYPTGIVVDPAGNIYVLDSNNQSARKVSPQGSVSTIAAASTSNQGLALGVLKPQNIFQGIALDNSINCFAVFCVTYKWGPSAYSSDTTLVEITPTGATSTINEWLYNFLVYGGILGDSGDKERGMALDQFNRLYLVEGNVIYQRALVTGPSIATQPQSQTVNAGQSVTFTVAANGSPLPTYQWQKNGTAISGATSATLMLGNAQTADAGNYSVIVSTGYGAVTSAAATLTVNVPPTITTQPQSQVVPVGVNVTFAVNASGTAPLSYQWKKGAIALANGGNISGATSATLTLANVQLADAGNYSVVVTNAVGNLTSNATTLTVYVPTSAPTSQFVTPGSSVVFAVTTSGPGSPTYQWELNGAAIAGATNATYTVANAQSGNMGFYSVTVSNGAGSVDSAVAILTVSGGSSRLMSLSARGYIQTGGDLTPGIALRGTGTKTLLIRAVGPTLSGFGVNGPLSDPKLDVIPFGATTPVVSNDDWGTNANVAALRVAMAAVGAFPLVEGSKDAAVLTTTATPNLAGNNLYTVRITPGGTATSGIVLTEVYDTEGATAPVKLVALSTRGFTSPNDNVLTSGFWIVGDGSKQLLIRAVGPTLGTAPYNVPGVLADPQFVVIPFGRNFTVASNDNWGGTAELQAAFAQTNDFALPTNSRDAAAIVRLPPGGYTVQATGVGDTTGNVLVEIYDMDP
jgi:sugar lactone lactonase YvrE